jgi:hypothetical protein
MMCCDVAVLFWLRWPKHRSKPIQLKTAKHQSQPIQPKTAKHQSNLRPPSTNHNHSQSITAEHQSQPTATSHLQQHNVFLEFHPLKRINRTMLSKVPPLNRINRLMFLRSAPITCILKGSDLEEFAAGSIGFAA